MLDRFTKIRRLRPIAWPARRESARPVFAFIAVGFALAAGPPFAAGEPSSDAAARAAIFGEEVLVDVLKTRRRTVEMSVERRFEFLMDLVFPPDSEAVRIDIDFTPTHPPPLIMSKMKLEAGWAAEQFQQPQSRVAMGGELISPAIDLVEAARQLGKLDDLRRTLDQRTSDSEADSKPRLALLALIACADRDFEAAQEAIGVLRDAAANEPVVHAERGPEAVAMWAGAEQPQTRSIARDLAFLVYEQARNGQGPRSERWHRQAYALKHLLQWTAEHDDGPAPASAEPLSSWRRVSRMTAETCGKGFPVARWDTRPGHARHVTGHDDDYLYYAAPLTGDFEVEGDFTTFGYREIRLAVGGVWAGPRYDLKMIENGDFRRVQDALPIDPPLTRMHGPMRVRVVVRDGTRTTYINGRKVFESPHPEGTDPWIAIHSPWYTNGAVRDLRITGKPTIPAEIHLAGTPDLPGWLPYYDESAGHAEADWRLEPQANSEATSPGAPAVLVGKRRPEIAGSYQESLLRYHRPMLEDGVIEYEFFYRPGEIAMHPALGRLCFLVNPEGVGVHWLTDGKFDRTGLDPANVAPLPESQRGDRPLPLRSNAWNQLQLRLRGDTINLSLNGRLVFSRTLEPTNQRTFGLFHYADQTEARVRNLRWRGEWPRELPPPAQQQLAGGALDEQLGDPAKLPVVFEHDFSEGLPLDRFLVMGTGWEDHVEMLPGGVRMKRPGGNYARYALAPQLRLSGDFDVTVAFEDFATSIAEGGEGNIQLLAALDDERSTECRVFRKHYRFSDGRSEHLAQAAVFQRRGGDTDYSFPASPPEESTSGRLRLARRGTQLFFLYAEEDSPEFRLIHSQQVAAADTRTAGVRLVLETNKDGVSQVVWKSLTVRAASASGPIASPSLAVAQLDEQRRRLPVKGRLDFSTSASRDAFTLWGPSDPFSWDREGMKIEALGAKQWTAAGIMSRVGLEGDFDVSLDLDVLHIETPAANSESTVYLQTEFDDARKTAIEIKYAISPSGVRAAEVQLNTSNDDGSTTYQELSTKRLDTIRQLRLARRDGVAYLIFQAGEKHPPQVLARAEVGDAPVPPTFLRALVHTGGVGRKTVVRFEKLTIRAERLIGPAGLLEEDE